uniref:Uncharacterized protein n=1 Tax=viral metagenome TaxID=1070528 RepID=A0A6M3L1M4_9ZZZZ
MTKLTEADKKEIVKLLEDKKVIEPDFYGAVEIKTEAGKLVIIKKTTSIK